MSDTLIRDNKNYGSVGEFLKDVINAVNIPVIKRRYFTPSSSEISNLSAHIVPIAVSLFFNTNGFTLLPPVL